MGNRGTERLGDLLRITQLTSVRGLSPGLLTSQVEPSPLHPLPHGRVLREQSAHSTPLGKTLQGSVEKLRTLTVAYGICRPPSLVSSHFPSALWSSVSPAHPALLPQGLCTCPSLCLECSSQKIFACPATSSERSARPPRRKDPHRPAPRPSPKSPSFISTPQLLALRLLSFSNVGFIHTCQGTLNSG